MVRAPSKVFFALVGVIILLVVGVVGFSHFLRTKNANAVDMSRLSEDYEVTDAGRFISTQLTYMRPVVRRNGHHA